MPGGNEVVGSGLESTSASGDFYGRVSYFHAGGIDRPLLITKEGVESVVPRETWRGQFHKGTSPATGLVRDCPIGVQTGCLLIAWPGMQTNAAHSWGGEQPDIRVWYGGLVDGMRDASGQMYMRNRYYDPATGQFTQTDPIGLAGGLNAYGFAAGDPVTYSDPYGLCPTADGGDDGKPCNITLTIQRESETSHSTQGSFTLTSNLPGAGTVTGATLEPPGAPDPQGNGTIRIRAGTYRASEVAVGASTKRSVLRLEDRNGRTNIMVHPGNFPRDTEGCILAGTSTSGPDAVAASRPAVNAIRNYIDRVQASDGGRTPNISVVVVDP